MWHQESNQMTPRPPIESASSPSSVLHLAQRVTSNDKRPILHSRCPPFRRSPRQVRRPDIHTQPDQIARNGSEGKQAVIRVWSVCRLSEPVSAGREEDEVHCLGYGYGCEEVRFKLEYGM